MLYPEGIGVHKARPTLCHSCLCLASIFISVRETLMRKFFEKMMAFWGRLGGSPRNSPRGRLGFAKGEAKSTSVFVRVRAPKGSDGSQKISK